MKTTFLIGIVVSVIGTQTVNAQWKQTGGPSTGTVTTLIATDSVILAGTINTIYRSTDNGNSWMEVGAGLQDSFSQLLGFEFDAFNVTSFAAYDSTILAGTYFGLVFGSTDYGRNWVPLADNAFCFLKIYSVARCNGFIFAGTAQDGLYRRTPDESQWTIIDTSQVSGDAYPILVHDNMLFIGTNGGVSRSMDNGDTWSFSDSGLGRYYSGISLVFDSSVMYAGTHRGVYVSTDTGISWSRQCSGLADTTVTSLAVKDGAVFAGTEYGGVFMTGDNGLNWSPVNTGLAAMKIVELGANSTALFAVTPEGVFRSGNNGADWSASDSGIISSGISSLRVHNGSLYAVVTGNYVSCRSVCFSDDRGTTWNVVPNIPHDEIICQAVNDSGLFLGTDEGLIFSPDKGVHWVTIDTAANFFHTIFIADTVLLAGTSEGIRQYVNDGSGWTGTATLLSDGCVYSLYVRGDTIITGVDHTLFVSPDFGMTWTEITAGLPNDGMNRITSLVSTGETLFAGCSFDGVFRSTDGGVSWDSVNTGLSDHQIKSLVAKDSTLYAGTTAGVFTSSDNGNNWTSVNAGLAHRHVRTLCYDDTTLFAGTAWNGVWYCPFSALTAIRSDNRNRAPHVTAPYSVHKPSVIRPRAVFELSLSHSGEVSIAVFNLSGQKVVSLVNGKLSRGSHRFIWQTGRILPGKYVAEIRIGPEKYAESITVLR